MTFYIDHKDYSEAHLVGFVWVFFPRFLTTSDNPLGQECDSFNYRNRIQAPVSITYLPCPQANSYFSTSEEEMALTQEGYVLRASLSPQPAYQKRWIDGTRDRW